MNATRTQRTKLTMGAALAVTALAAPSASATPVKGGTATITITGGTARALKRGHVTARAANPAKARARSYSFPVGSGSFDFRTNRGSLLQAGRLVLAHGRSKVVLTRLRLTLGHNSKLIATVGGHAQSLGSLSAPRQVRESASGRSLGTIQIRLSAAGAKLLNRKLRTRAFSARGAVASLSITVARSSAGSGAADGSKTAASAAATAKIALAPALAAALTESGLSPAVTGGAQLLPDGTLNLPVLSTQIDPQTGSGTIKLSGGLTLGSGDNAIRIQDPEIVVGADQAGVYAQVNGVRSQLAVLDQTGLRDALQKGLNQLSSAITLTPGGASLLNQLGGVSLFVAGTPLGDVSVTLPSSQAVSS